MLTARRRLLARVCVWRGACDEHTERTESDFSTALFSHALTCRQVANVLVSVKGTLQEQERHMQEQDQSKVTPEATGVILSGSEESQAGQDQSKVTPEAPGLIGPAPDEVHTVQSQEAAPSF